MFGSNIEKITEGTNTKYGVEEIQDPSLLSSYITSEINIFLEDNIETKINPFNLVDNILNIVNEKVGTHSISGLSRSGKYLILHSGKTQLVFNITSNKIESLYVGENIETIISNDIKTQLNINKKTESLEKTLNSMDHIFNENQKEYFDFLDEDDILKTDMYGPDLKGENIKNIQLKARYLINDIDLLRNSLDYGNIKIDNTINQLKEKYLDFVLGVGDKYEGGAGLFDKTDEELSNIINDIIGSKQSFEDIFIYMYEKYSLISKNTYKSTSVEESYLLFSSKLNDVVFKKLKDENASDSQFLTFAKIITGRDYKIGNEEFSGELDSDLKNSELSNQAILYVMSKKGGILDKINKSSHFDIHDDEIGDKTPNLIISDFISKINIKTSDGNVIKGSNLLNQIGFSDVLDLGESSYSELTIQQKIKISTLARVVSKIENDGITQAGDLQKIFMTTAEEGIEAVIDGINDNFDASFFDWDGKKSSDFGLEGLDAEIFDLFNDINGNGLFDFSDETIGVLSDIGNGAKFLGAVILSGIATAVVLKGVVGGIVIGMAVGAVASVVSISLGYKGYDSAGEMSLDISTDILLGTLTGGIGSKLIQIFGNAGAKILSKGGLKNASIVGFDIAVLGILAESKRAQTIDEAYHGEGVLD